MAAVTQIKDLDGCSSDDIPDLIRADGRSGQLLFQGAAGLQGEEPGGQGAGAGCGSRRQGSRPQ